MKIYLKFDHSQEDSLKAIGCEYGTKKVNERIDDVIQDYILDDSLLKTSQLSEMIHRELDYEEILFLATVSVEVKMHAIMIEQMKQEFKNFLNL